MDWEDPLEKGEATHPQYSGLENSMDRGAWWAMVHRFTKSWIRLSDLHFTLSSDNVFKASLIAQLVKNPPAMQETPVRFLGQEDPLEKG